MSRRASFENWNYDFIDPGRLSMAGFYYSGSGDSVKCFCCGITLCEWEEDEDPVASHQRWKPTCIYITTLLANDGDVSMANSAAEEFIRNRSIDVCGSGGGGNDLTLATVNSQTQLSSQDCDKMVIDRNLLAEDIGIKHYPPNHTKYVSVFARLESFNTWPKYLLPSKEKLAEAGFFYTGTGDQTGCFHCGGVLQDWAPYDSPWEEHAKSFPRCFFLNMLAKKHNKTVSEFFLVNFDKKTTKQSKTLDENIETDIDILKLPNEPAKSFTNNCKICIEEDLNVAFLPCHHAVSCTNCACSLEFCPICRKKIAKSIYIIIC